MTWQIIRQVRQIQVVRGAGPTQVGAVTAYRVLRSPGGPRGVQGQDAGQDIGWGPLTGGFADSEVIDGPPLAHAASYGMIWVHTRAGVASTQSIGLLRNGALAASVTLHPGDRDVALPIATVVGAAGDVFSLAMPSPPDTQLTDLTVTLGSVP